MRGIRLGSGQCPGGGTGVGAVVSGTGGPMRAAVLAGGMTPGQLMAVNTITMRVLL